MVMTNRNASASAFGWDFQANAALVLMLENIKNAKSVRVEGAIEDIEITLVDNKKIYAQAKAVTKYDDYSNVDRNLKKALMTLNDDSSNNDGKLFTYITNSPNPFNSKNTMMYFTRRTHLDFEELPEVAKKKIEKIINEHGYSNLDVNKFDIRVIPFYGNDLKNRYKEIQARVIEFFQELEIDEKDLSMKIMNKWQTDFFQNASQIDTSIVIDKDKMIWTLIVLVIDKIHAKSFFDDYNEEEIEEIEQKYRLIIDHNTMNYQLIVRVFTDFLKNNKRGLSDYINQNWSNFMDIGISSELNPKIKETLIKIILFRILKQKEEIKRIKKGTNL